MTHKDKTRCIGEGRAAHKPFQQIEKGGEKARDLNKRNPRVLTFKLVFEVSSAGWVEGCSYKMLKHIVFLYTNFQNQWAMTAIYKQSHLWIPLIRLSNFPPVEAFSDWVHRMWRASKLLIFHAGMPDGGLCGRCVVLRCSVLQQPPEAWQPQQQQQEQQHWESEGRRTLCMEGWDRHRRNIFTVDELWRDRCQSVELIITWSSGAASLARLLVLSSQQTETLLHKIQKDSRTKML